jgi:hypothetical protein
MVFLIEMDGYQKMRDTNKNVIKMGVIIKGVYCILMLRKLFFTCLCFFLGFLGLQNFKAWRKLTFIPKKRLCSKSPMVHEQVNIEFTTSL